MFKKYLYIYKYFAQFEESLAKGEFEAVFHEPMESNYYFSDVDYDYTRSVFIKARLDILHCAKTIEELLALLEGDHLYYEDFKVLYYKNKITHVDYKESLAWCRRLSEPIAGTTDLEHPKVEFALTKIHDEFYFGLLHRNHDWHQYEEKPYSYSHALPLRVARTAINLGLGDKDTMSIIDPACGIGTVVIEGLAMGLDIVGSDINRYVAYQARKNLIHFGFDPLIINRCDLHEITKQYDLGILDVPYGVFSAFSMEDQLAMIAAMKNFTQRAVIITHDQYLDEFEKMGYHIISQCTYRKAGFMRYLTVVERKQS